MVSRRVLVSWIGHTDIRAMGLSLPKERQTKLSTIVGDLNGVKDHSGPVKTLLVNETFDQIHLLSNYKPWINKEYKKWVGTDPTIHAAGVDNPTDYKAIYLAVDGILRSIIKVGEDEKVELVVLLSPGTPAMAAIWVLLGKSKYPAKFYQTYNGKAWETEIPFDLTLDFIPELLQGSDSVFQHLAVLSPQDIEGFEKIIGSSKLLRLAVGRARKVALRDVSVLLLGESGSGKEMFARAIHAASRRKEKPFIAINCAAIPKDLLESELFGHVKGAFTGADKAREGAFMLADGGTVFLDEIGDCDPVIQAKLLRVLQPPPGAGPCVREFQLVGGSKIVTSDTRVIAATNQNLLQRIEASEFREDLFYRLAVVSIQLPPLRERKSDSPMLAQAILDKINTDFALHEPGYKYKSISASAKQFVKQYPWPGNVRQLNNVILQAAVMSECESLTKTDLEAAITAVPGISQQEDILSRPLDEEFSVDQVLNEVQIHYIQRAMRQAGGTKSKAARLLGMKNYQTLDAQIKRFDVEWEGTDE
ncbi:sigma-54 interaction domain-containing protein [Planctomycetota bacterium]